MSESESEVAISGTPLPKIPSRLCNSPTIRGAYTQILSLEKSEQAAYDCDENDDQYKRLMYARIVGYLLLEGVSDKARIAVALEVVSCNNEADKLLAIGQYYFDHFLCAFRKYGSRTPIPSEHDSCSSFCGCRETTMNMIVEAPEDHQQAKTNALIRDGFHCILSGRYEYAIRHRKELKEAVHAAGVTSTGCVHIITESTNANIISGNNAQADKHQYSAAVWAVLNRFGYNNIVDELSGAKIHRLENVFTMDFDARSLFDKLYIWFEHIESVDQPNTYRVCEIEPGFIDTSWKKTVTFTTPDPVKLPVPSRKYLDLHAACCRVAHLSGAGEYIERKMENIDEDSDTSAEVL